MMFYCRVGLSQASHYSINTGGTDVLAEEQRKFFRQGLCCREVALQMEANLGEKSLKISMAEPVGNCFKIHNLDEARAKGFFPVVHHRQVVFLLSIEMEGLSLEKLSLPSDHKLVRSIGER